MKGYHFLSAAQEAEIRRLTETGKSQKQIGHMLHIHRSSVHRVQKKMGLSLPYRGARRPVLTAAEKRRVLRLLKKGVGTVPIAKRLNLRAHAVRRFAEEIHFRRQPGEYGFRLRLSETEKEKILQEIRLRVNHASDIAAKFPDVPYRSIVQMAHKELKCPRFRSGCYVEPLSSDFPSKHFPGEVGHG